MATLALLLSFQGFAQNVALRGSVRDAGGQALSGASVTLQGTTRGVMTDASGNYSISVTPGRYTLVVSYVGYATQNVDVNV